MAVQNIHKIREKIRSRKAALRKGLWEEVDRLVKSAAELGVRKVVLFGSLVRGEPGLTSDVDLLFVWDTPLTFLTRSAELYRVLKPQVPTDILAYTPKEMERMADSPLVKRALEEGRVLYEA